jgi:hypothetical protein
MANVILSAAQPRYFSPVHHTEAARVAHHTAAVNSLALARFNLTSDSGSLNESIKKTEQALVLLRRLRQLSEVA